VHSSLEHPPLGGIVQVSHPGSVSVSVSFTVGRDRPEPFTRCPHTTHAHGLERS
jgi:hypothetical protein